MNNIFRYQKNARSIFRIFGNANSSEHFRYHVCKGQITCVEKMEEIVDDELDRILAAAEFRQEALYSNIPISLVGETLIETAQRMNAKDALLISLKLMPRLLAKIKEKSMSPYALFARV